METPSRRPPLGSLELRCPPLPHTILEAFDLIDHPERMDVMTVTRMVERDPSVAARLLQNVNSAYYGLKRTITSVERAVVLIGPVPVTGIVVGMNMLRLKSVVRTAAADTYARLMRHSLATAFVARHLEEGPPGTRRPPAGQQFGIAFTAGLLHDFGKIILVYNYPDQAVALYDDSALRQHVDEPDLTRLEALLFGCDHTEAGEYAARKLNFPELLVSAMRYHHRSADEAPHLGLTKEARDVIEIVQASNLAARALGYGFSMPLRWAECIEHPIWTRLCALPQVGFDDPQELLNDLYLQRHHIDAYVEPLTTSLTESFA